MAKARAKIVPNTEPTIADETTVGPKETAAALWARPQTDKLRGLNLAMCPKGRLFGAKSSCKCCGARVESEGAPIKKARTRKPRITAPVYVVDGAPVLSETQRQRNREAAASRKARRAGLGQP